MKQTKIPSRFYDTDKLKQKILEVRGENYELIGEYNPYTDSRKHLTILHKTCGNTWEISRNNLLKGRECKYCCRKNKSSLSTKVENFLRKNSICYEIEFTFEECKNERPLPFDFIVYDANNNLKCLIETDGEQHFKETGYSRGGLKAVQARDKIKTDFCNSKNYTLVRIPFYDEDKISTYLDFLKIDKDSICPNKEKPYFSKSITTEKMCNDVRYSYLKLKSMKALKKLYGISETVVYKIIAYHYFPESNLDIKEDIDKIYERNSKKHIRKISELSREEIELAKKLKKQGHTDSYISEMFGVHRKFFPYHIKDWANLNVKSRTLKVKHKITLKIFETLSEACRFYNLNYSNELHRLTKKLDSGSFDLI